jgi:hypothetical protein
MNKLIIAIVVVAVIAVGAVAGYSILNKDSSEPSSDGINYGEGFELKSTIQTYDGSQPTKAQYYFKTTSSSSNMLRLNIMMNGTNYSTNATMMKLTDTSYSAKIDSADMYYYAEYIPSKEKWYLINTSDENPKIKDYNNVLSYTKDDNILFRLTEVVINTFNLCTSGPYQCDFKDPFFMKDNKICEQILMGLRAPTVCYNKHVAFGETGEKYKTIIVTGTDNIVRTNDTKQQEISNGSIFTGNGYYANLKLNTYTYKTYSDGELLSSVTYDSDIGLTCSYTMYEDGKTQSMFWIDYVKQT